MMLSDKDLSKLIENRKLVIRPFDSSAIGCASIDLTLSDKFAEYSEDIDSHVTPSITRSFSASNIKLLQNGFVLGMTREYIRIPNGYYGFIETRGNFARAGITVSSNDGHIDPGTDSMITLEIHNRNSVGITLYAGDRICQLFICQLSSPSSSLYTGKYAHQTKPTVFIP